ncbi:dihydroxyacetone kinase subunit DhaK, partial [Rhizobium ruizarguesonis]
LTTSRQPAPVSASSIAAMIWLGVKNYDGDLMNFEMAIEMAGDRHNIEMVVVSDDIETSRSGEGNGRRGVDGTLIVEKLLGAADERGMSLA